MGPLGTEPVTTGTGTDTGAGATPVPLHRRYTPDRATTPQPGADPTRPSEPRPAGLYEGEPEACRRDIRQFLPILAQLGLLVAVAWIYRIEGQAFWTLITLACVGLPIHYLLPYHRKKRFFLALSVGGMLAVWGVSVGLMVAAVAGGLIGLCYLPVSWKVRAGLVASVGVGLAIARGTTDVLPGTFWPVLGSMMIFRMMIYLYELKHARKPEPLTDSLGYFFLLPNYCFLHFPVVDYRTWQRGYFADEVHATMRTGLGMIFRGLLQLLAYRLIYHEVLIPMEEVTGPATLARFLAANYLLYLHVSGQFHTACGMLHLFGYKLPETHHYFLLATGFTDYWRRINIYWKDFMVRIVFNPIVFALKRKPQALVLAFATAVVFVTTWFLHAYQTYWLRGTWNFSVPDALFWGILGVLVVVNVQQDLRASKRRRLKKSEPSRAERLRGGAIRCLKVAGTLTTIMLLWALWSSPSVEAWLSMLARGVGLASMGG